ncbi:nuclear transport factor 2 family protein [Nocardia sp. NBC_01503]|uniref:nuclear transport factor 2 family protein n=1 Tax=Nocardia sp. NBC_01503 TaxID=2975997 RepID=UPI002E7BF1A8|nr:nuclear transport factor 2 family protein [Nocardia sp. NBC_01503]WTL31986.1 nuclear transport factor 2 family protein [Nocardia sp. NBC_01503]
MQTPNDFRTLADRVEIAALPGEFTDAVMVRDFDRLASLFTEDAVLSIPAAGIVVRGGDVRTRMRTMQDAWEYFIQHTHPGAIEIDGDTATGRAHICELGKLKTGAAHVNYAIYHDTYRRTSDGWKFTERVYEIRYLDSSPLAGGPLEANGLAITPEQLHAR